MPCLKKYIPISFLNPYRLSAVKNVIFAAGQIIAVSDTESLHSGVFIRYDSSFLVHNPYEPVFTRIILLQIFIYILRAVRIVFAKKALTKYPIVLK